MNLFGMLLRYVCVFYGIYFPSSEVVGHCGVVWLWSAVSTVDSSKDVWQKQECLGCSCSGTSMFQIYGGVLQLCCTKQICAVL